MLTYFDLLILAQIGKTEVRRPLNFSHCNIKMSCEIYMGVSKNRGTPKSSILIGFSIIFTIHFGGNTPIFGNIHIHLWSLPDPRLASSIWVPRAATVSPGDDKGLAPEELEVAEAADVEVSGEGPEKPREWVPLRIESKLKRVPI